MSLKILKDTWVTTLFSVLLLSGVTYFLLWSEYSIIRSTVQTEQLLNSVNTLLINVDQREYYNGYPVIISGPLQVLEPLSDPDYSIQVLAVKLKRRVQMYQWIEEVSEESSQSGIESDDDTKRTYWYHKEWKDYVVDSSSFHNSLQHKNPTSIPLFSETQIAETVKIGWVTLDMELKRQVSDYYDITSDNRPERSDIKMHSGFYYHGESALEHEIGDLRVSFQYAGREDDIYTAAGILDNGVIKAFYETPDSEGVCILRKGAYTPETLINMEARDRRIRLWKYRALGLLQVFAATMTLSPDWLTIVLKSSWSTRRVRRMARLWVNLMLAFSYTFIVVSIPWVRYNPGYGFALFGIGMLPLLRFFQLPGERQDAVDSEWDSDEHID